VNVLEYVPAALYELPFHVYGNVLLHTDTGVELLDVCLTVNTNVATESHPTAFVNVLEYVPAALYDVPFHTYGNVLLHTDTGVELLDVCLTVNTNVATESHPTAFVNVLEYVPAALYELPFHAYGNVLLHTDTGVELLDVCLMVIFAVTVLSHPAAEV
jgi:glutamine cyclotransferase